jgi:hypothetical protein
MSGQHTPGPWGVRDTPNMNREGFHWREIFQEDAPAITLAEVFMDDEEISNGEARANARLIAAAPDLLNELEASAKMLRTLVEVAEDIRLEGAPIIRERLVSVEAAIARARGEQA